MEADRYHMHPGARFRATDELPRIRRADQGVFLTYKGPKLDATTKTRHEIELPLGSEASAAEAWATCWCKLDSGVAEVRKRRARRRRLRRQIEMSLDELTRWARL